MKDKNKEKRKETKQLSSEIFTMVAGLCHIVYFVFWRRKDARRKNEKTKRRHAKRRKSPCKKKTKKNNEITPCEKTKTRNPPHEKTKLQREKTKIRHAKRRHLKLEFLRGLIIK